MGAPLLGGRAMATFDAMGQWPWAKAVEAGTDVVFPEWTARWGCCRPGVGHRDLPRRSRPRYTLNWRPERLKRPPFGIPPRGGLAHAVRSARHDGRARPSLPALVEADSLSRAMLRAERV